MGRYMQRPYELTTPELKNRLDEMITATMEELQSQFLVLPKGTNFIEYEDFQDAYEALRRQTNAFAAVTEATVWTALQEDALALVVLRTIIGLNPSEWAAMARSERNSDIKQGYARGLDSKCRTNRRLLVAGTSVNSVRTRRVSALIAVAVDYMVQGAPAGAADTVHRLAKVDTAEGLSSLSRVANHDVPYASLLYERYLGRPYASHRDSISSLIGDTMEGAIEEMLARARIGFRKTRRAERIPGFDQAPDFVIPDELNPAVVIEAKIASDDGTARDKVNRIMRLHQISLERKEAGKRSFEVVACIDGRGFGVRREDMRRIIESTEGKVFTLATLDKLIQYTRLREFLPRTQSISS